MKRALFLVCVLCLMSCVEEVSESNDGPGADLFVPLPRGETKFSEIGIYRVGYQLYGQPVVYMPLGWRGHFTDDVGIAFCREDSQGGKSVLLLHCPWRRGTGPAFVEYHLALPEERPIRLAFSIAMRERNIGQSDGVTFSVFAGAPDAPRQLMREHYAEGKWRNFEFDLSSFAGKRIAVKFQTEPGPAQSAGFDFSLLGDARMILGDATPRLRARLEKLMSAPAYRASVGKSLLDLSNRCDVGIVPSCNDRFTNAIVKAGKGYDLIYDGDDCKITYSYRPSDGTLSDWLVHVGSTRPFRPCDGGGVFFVEERSGSESYFAPGKAELDSLEADGKRITACWKYSHDGLSADVVWEFRIDGKALVIQADSKDLTIGQISLGGAGLVPFRKEIPVPYLPVDSATYLPEQNVYTMSYLDWTESHASRSPGGMALYYKKLDGSRNPIREVGYVSVSPELPEVLPNVPHPPSPHLKLLGPLMMVDIWGGRFRDDARMLREYKSAGIDNVAIIKHSWQCFGYDVKLPDHLPANERMGGDEGMKELARTARELGYLFSVHENYIDFYPDAPSFNEKDVVLSTKGEFQKAYLNKGTGVQSFALKANRMGDYASRNAPEIHKRFGTTAAYLDVHTCTPPWHYVDFDAKQEMAGMHKCKVKYHPQLFQYMRDTHGGPLFGEGANHFYWAGLIDGVEAQVRGGEDAPLLLDLDLLKIHPQMVNHGMGYYTRWLRTGRQTKWGVEAPTPEQLDKYRAMELAFGHAAFVGSQVLRVLPLAVREHNIVTPVQACYGTSKPVEILYEVEGEMVPSSIAAALGILDRARVKYESNLVLHVNLRQEDWQVGGYRIPQCGFLARGPGLLAYTARLDGVIVDYSEDSKVLYADARTWVYRPWEEDVTDVRPRVKSFKDLGDGKFEICYEWSVDEKLREDYHCFVHFCTSEVDRPDGIVFQNDHALRVPTSQWQGGEAVNDGPYTVSIPSDASFDSYDILMGLFLTGGGRLKIRGIQEGDDRILVGRLTVRKEDRKVNVSFGEARDRLAKQAELRKQFEERMNLEGKAIDFGSVRTDGAFKLYKDRMVILPNPCDGQFAITLRLAQVGGPSAAKGCMITAYDREGNERERFRAEVKDGILSFQTTGAARYQLKFEE